MRRSASTGAVERRLWKDQPRARRTIVAATGAVPRGRRLLDRVRTAPVRRRSLASSSTGGRSARSMACSLAMLGLVIVARRPAVGRRGRRPAGGGRTRRPTSANGWRPRSSRWAPPPSGASGSASSSTRRGRGSRASTRTSRATSLRAPSPCSSRSWWRSSSSSLDPWSVPILLIAGPVLVLLLGLIGRRVRDLAERRERELAWMNAHFLDVLRGLPT